MFLGRISPEQKQLFLQLAQYAALANSTVQRKERAMLTELCREMDIAYSPSPPAMQEEQVLEKLAALSTRREMQVYLYEILVLLWADHDLDLAEDAFLNRVCRAFRISSDKVEEYCDLIEQYQELMNEIADVVRRLDD